MAPLRQAGYSCAVTLCLRVRTSLAVVCTAGMLCKRPRGSSHQRVGVARQAVAAAGRARPPSTLLPPRCRAPSPTGHPIEASCTTSSTVTTGALFTSVALAFCSTHTCPAYIRRRAWSAGSHHMVQRPQVCHMSRAGQTCDFEK
jgi:hypothetical protein